jgi:2,3-bisphosphoglycerate-independent phosphoglycerate mutase
MKYIVIIPDGVADTPLEALDGKTPLQVANTPNLDYLAQHGAVGQVRTIPEGMPPGSDVGNLALLGYDPKEAKIGRAALEAANLDIDLEDDGIAFRCNLVTVENNQMVDYSAGHISTDEAKMLIETLNQEIDLDYVRFYVGKSYRHIMVLRLRNSRDYLSIQTTPPHDIMGQTVTPFLPQGPQAGMVLKFMEKSKGIFEAHSVNHVRIDLQENPANMIWLWGQGMKPRLVPFAQKFQLRGAIISAVDLVNGIGKIAGLKVVSVPGATGYYDTNYRGKAEHALNALKESDFVYVHVEATDEASHNGDVEQKIKAIENIDREIVGTVLNHFDRFEDARILVTPDHRTPIACRTHTADPVCFVMYGTGIPNHQAPGYSETVAEASDWYFDSGEALLNCFIKKYL